jgi:hypothetical protein
MQDKTFGTSLNSSDTGSKILVLIWIRVIQDKTSCSGLSYSDAR